MAVTITVFDLPVVPDTADPILHDPLEVGRYGTNAVDVVLDEAQASVQNALPLDPEHPIVLYDNNLIPWNKNPIDRQDYVNPVPTADVTATFTNRNKLLKMLNIFMFPPNNYYHGDLTFKVSRVGNVVYYLDGPLGLAPGPMEGPDGPLPGGPGMFGIPFEELIAANVDPNLEKYFIFQSYSLLGATNLLVRTEVDCMNQVPQITEIKSKKAPNNPHYTIWTDSNYFKTVWAQMLFGCAESLVMGVHVPVPNAPDGTRRARFDEITTRTFAEVAALAHMTNDEDYMPPLRSLVNLIAWIRGNIADGENKTFSYSKDAQTFTLAV